MSLRHTVYDSRSKAGNSWANSNRISKEVLIKGLLTKVWAQLRESRGNNVSIP